MEAKEIMDIIVGILASLGLFTCLVAASYCLYSIVTTDRLIKRDLERLEDETAKTKDGE